MTHFTVNEWESIAVQNDSSPVKGKAFSRSQADALLKAARSHPSANRSGTNILIDYNTKITARQVVGVIAAQGCSLEILPKIDANAAEPDSTIRKRLVRMLDVALGLDVSDGQSSTMARQNETLLDILIRIFTQRLLAEARRGLPRAYLAQEEDLPTLRGKLDIRRQFTVHAVRPDRLACRFDTLMADTPLLRIMKACVVLLRRHARAIETSRNLDELRFLFADITDVRPENLPWAQVRIDRTNRRWETLFALAKLFLKREWQATHHDSSAGQGITLLFAMNDLFEAYVAALARKALLGTQWTVHSQGGRLPCLQEDREDGKPRFQTKPDILIKDNGATVVVIDTKWKHIGRDPEDAKLGVSQADIYQMMAYSRLYGCGETMLLYPHHKELGDVAWDKPYRMLGSNAPCDRLRIASVDIAAREADIVDRLKQLVVPVKVQSQSMSQQPG